MLNLMFVDASTLQGSPQKVCHRHLFIHLGGERETALSEVSILIKQRNEGARSQTPDLHI